MRSLTPLLRRLGLVELKANPKAPETRLPFVVIDEQTGEDWPGYGEFNAEMRALAQRSGVSPKEYGFDILDAFYGPLDELLPRFLAIDETRLRESESPVGYPEFMGTSGILLTHYLYTTTAANVLARKRDGRLVGGSDREVMQAFIDAYPPLP